jgi:hypothetical protein
MEEQFYKQIGVALVEKPGPAEQEPEQESQDHWNDFKQHDRHARWLFLKRIIQESGYDRAASSGFPVSQGIPARQSPPGEAPEASCRLTQSTITEAM